MRIAELLGEIGQHGGDDTGIRRRRRLVIEIDRRRIDAGGAITRRPIDHAALAATRLPARP